MKENNLTQRLRGRAAYLRNIGEGKSPDLMEAAADEIERLRVAATKLGRSDEWEDLRDDLHHAAAEIEQLRGAATVALDAFETHAKQYPHMQKGYTVDAIEALRAALTPNVPVKGRD